MRISTLALIAALTATPVLAAPPVEGPVLHQVIVDISDQMMYVYLDGILDAEWPVSTAGQGAKTKLGSWSPDFLSKNHRSKKYNNAPMPFAIFYDGNYAIHGTEKIDKIGTPDSRGCVRLRPENAENLFERVSKDGLQSMRITIIE